jgi:HEAT repeat protein
VPWLVRLGRHPNPDIRWALACMLPQFGPDRADVVDLLVTFLADPSITVRDWASFAFSHQLTSPDSPTLRENLHHLTRSDNRTIISQAVHALALRGDVTVLPALENALDAEPDDATAELVEAVRALPDPRLLPTPTRLQASDWGADDTDLRDLIRGLAKRS